MGLTSKEYYSMTPAEFYLAMRGFNTAEWKRWEHTRFIAYNVAKTIPRKKGSRLPGIKKWLPLPTDKTVDQLTEVSHMDAVFNKLKEKSQNGRFKS